MTDSPLAITLDRPDTPSAVELEVAFVAEDETEPLDRLLFAPNGSAANGNATGSESVRGDGGGGDGGDGDGGGVGVGSGAGGSVGGGGSSSDRGERAGLSGVRMAALALGARVLGAAGAVHVLGGLPVRAVVGLGPRAEITLDILRRAAAHAVGCATDLRRATLAIDIPANLPPSIAVPEAVEVITEGALLAAHARAPRATLSPKPDTLIPPTRCVLRMPETTTAAAHPASTGPPAAATPPDEGAPRQAASPANAGPPTGATPPDEDAPGQAASPASTGPPTGATPPQEGAPRQAPSLEARMRRAEAHAAAVRLARELADMPANRLSPLQLAEQAAAALEAVGGAVEILGPPELEQLGAGLLLAVGSGSARPPALAVLRYTPPNARRHVAVVGKGITFDAGGINVKPAKGMGDMVHDKAGAAAAAAIAFGAAKLELPIAVTALLACAENLPSGAAYRPGDVLRGMDGATVEVIDTDAEGRLVLADALTYALRLSVPGPPDLLVDLATLTGSIVSALGNEAAGLFANDDALAAQMLAAAAAAGEPLWRMPILAGHRAQLKSERADRKQCAERGGDCAIAAAFLEMYVEQHPWLHLDIAGVAYNEGSPEWPPYHPKSGAAGAGVRTVLRFLEALVAIEP